MEKEIELENGLRIKIYPLKQTATVIKSEKVTGNVLIPRYVEDDGKKYPIISLSENAFEKAKFDSLIFSKNSEVETFEEKSFYLTCLTKLQIPPKLKKIHNKCFTLTKNLIDIEVSPKNKQFSYIENKYLAGKSQEDRDVFDVLLYARYDIEEAVIPPQIEIVKENSFNYHTKLKSVLFPNNSKLKHIEYSALSHSTLSKLVLPASLESIDYGAFCSVEYLNEIEVSLKNQTFSMINKTLLVKKIDPSSKVFDYLVLCRRDIEHVEIPSYIKVIGDYAFENCKKLNSVNFEPNSTLEKIKNSAFFFCLQLKNIIIPSSVKYIETGAFSFIDSIESIEILSSQITFGHSCFSYSKKLAVVSLPNATKLIFDDCSMDQVSKDTIFKIRKSAETSGEDFSKIENQVRYIEDEEKETKKIQEPPSSSNKSTRFNRDKETTVKKIKNEERENIEKYIKHIRFLESRLSKYEEVIPFDPNSTNNQENEYIDYETSNDELKSKENNKQDEKGIFIDEEDESHHQIISQIGEGATSYTYKVIDERNGDLMCKKVLKANDEKTTFKDFQNIFKEFEVLKQLSHPCICETIGINPQEVIKTDVKSNKKDFSQYEEEEEIEIKTNQATTSENNTTIAIFLKYHPMNLKECLERDILNNTLKAKLVVEIAFGMLHIHENGMIHRDLKLENVMVNFIFEAQLIDFGLAHVNDLKTTMTSMTKGIGTLAYMSPEMSNEEEYDNKTDVYSFGVLLFVLFTRRFPKQSMKDKLTNQKIRFPRPSAMISAFCIELIKKCMSFEPSKRPSFEEILKDISNNSFKFADEIESELVLRRYRTLNRFRMIEKRNKMKVVKEPSGPMKSNNNNNKKIIKKPVIIKPV